MQLEISDTSLVKSSSGGIDTADIHSSAGDKSLNPAAIAILQPIHQVVLDGIQRVGRDSRWRLLNIGSSTVGPWIEGSDKDRTLGSFYESRICRNSEVGMEVKQPQRVFIVWRDFEFIRYQVSKNVGRAWWRSFQSVLIRWQCGIVKLGKIGSISVEIDEGCGWISHQHFLAVEGIHADAVERAAECKLVDRHVIAIRPYAKLAVVGKLISHSHKVVGVVHPLWIAVL